MSTATDITAIILRVSRGGDVPDATGAALASIATAKRHAEWDAYRKAARVIRAKAKALDEDGKQALASVYRMIADDVAAMAPSRAPSGACSLADD